MSEPDGIVISPQFAGKGDQAIEPKQERGPVGMKAGTMMRLGVAGTAALMAATAGARAEEGVAIKNLLGSMGIIAPERDPIPYRERAPLVMPPKMELREPVAPGAVRAAHPQWPNDPDLAGKKRREAEARAPVTQSETRRMSDNNPRLSGEELRAGRRPGAGIPDGPVRHGDRDGVWVSPDQLRTRGGTQEAGTVTAGGAPVRRVLSDPPTELSRSASGGPIQKSFEPQVKVDEADPRAFFREQKGE